MQTFSALIEDDVFPALALENALELHAVIGGTAPSRVREALEQADRDLNTD